MQTYADRMEMIRAAHAKIYGKSTTRKTAERKARSEREDERYWTDARKYANEYYGDVYRETTRHDSEWD